MVDSGRELVSVEGKELEMLLTVISSFEQKTFEKELYAELAEEIRRFIGQKFENKGQLWGTYNKLRKRQFAILEGLRRHILMGGPISGIHYNKS